MTKILCLFFIGIVVLLLLSPNVLHLQSKADEVISVSNVLGRTIRLDVLCDDFEDTNWSYNPQTEKFYKKLWRGGSGRGVPKLLKRITPPYGGKNGSLGALEIATRVETYKDNDPEQDDLLTAEYEQILGRKLTRADQPVFIVHVWLPPLDQWSDVCNFGFRHESFPKNGNKYYPTIWMYYNKQVEQKPFFVFRIGTGPTRDVRGVSIDQFGWWTLAIAFDKGGIGHYYASPGVNNPTEKNEVFDTTRFRSPNGTDNPSMDYINYSFFSLTCPTNGNTSPRFVIDDYEVWVVK